MKIRKLFKFEGAHIVRDCSSDRCKKSIHGHSYKVELFFISEGIDNGQMVIDFGLLKTYVKDIIDSFDHSYTVWEKEKDDFKDFIKSHSNRYVITPYSPSAEMYSVMLFALINSVMQNTVYNNGENGVQLTSVRVHETDTGYAESNYADYVKYWLNEKHSIDSITFSKGVREEWGDPDMLEKIKKREKFVNPKIDTEY